LSRDNLGRVTNIHTNHGNTDIQYLDYTYDAVGNLKSKMDSRELGNEFYEEFTYDSINRLDVVNARTGNTTLIQTMSLDYDTAGRIIDFNGNTYHYTTGSIHGVDSITGSVNKSYSYDANGTQTNPDGRL